MQLIAQAPLQGAQQSVIAPTPAGEPQRLHILDWGRRMAGYEFSTAPEHCQPGKGRSHGKGMTHHQLNLFIRSDRGPSSGMNINAHSERKPQSMQSIALLFAGA
ncbi:hypothetical protein [Paraburkholderia sp. GAS348]|uniref:hypothetical protein n=1 Tax=Paraburkholderia sp. GAS348 TaxID=3035132 RepID=UPI003D25F834